MTKYEIDFCGCIEIDAPDWDSAVLQASRLLWSLLSPQLPNVNWDITGGTKID
jgi:hypothetical protein